jgi:hypothetical protein
MYMNLDKVGKETAQTRDAVHIQQLAEAQKLAQQTEAQSHSVAKTESTGEVADGQAGKVGADGRGKGGKPKGKNHEDGQEEAPVDKPTGFTDPGLGRHIDVKG